MASDVEKVGAMVIIATSVVSAIIMVIADQFGLVVKTQRIIEKVM